MDAEWLAGLNGAKAKENKKIHIFKKAYLFKIFLDFYKLFAESENLNKRFDSLIGYSV